MGGVSGSAHPGRCFQPVPRLSPHKSPSPNPGALVGGLRNGRAARAASWSVARGAPVSQRKRRREGRVSGFTLAPPLQATRAPVRDAAGFTARAAARTTCQLGLAGAPFEAARTHFRMWPSAALERSGRDKRPSPQWRDTAASWLDARHAVNGFRRPHVGNGHTVLNRPGGSS